MGISLTTVLEPASPAASLSSKAGWNVVAASVGGSKREPGELCEDAHSWVEADGVLIAAVADGAGSARRAAEGAAAASSFAVEHAAWLLAEGCSPAEALIGEVFSATRRRLTRLARQRLCRLADLATTLCIALITDEALMVGQVGDGAAVARTSDAGLKPLASNPKGEFVNETVFLTSDRWSSELVIEECRPVDGVALMTDGLVPLALDQQSGTAHRPFFAPLFRFASRPGAEPVELSRFLTSPRVADRADDDLTLLLVSR